MENSINNNPSLVSFIFPSRWMQGGRGLDAFRSKMLSDNRVFSIIDYRESKDCFSSVEIEGGINILSWSKSHNGNCKYEFIKNNNRSVSERDLSARNIIIREIEASKIVDKVTGSKEFSTFSSNVYPYWPFAFAHEKAFDDYRVKGDSEYDLMFLGNSNSGNLKDSNGIGFIRRGSIKRNVHLIGRHKVVVSKANGGALKSGRIISEPLYLPPNSVCTETYLVVGDYEDKESCLKLIQYMKTKFFRFLLSVKKISQNTTQDTFEYIPEVNLEEVDEVTDIYLFERYGLCYEDVLFINDNIVEMA